MRLNELKPAEGSRPASKRVGRGTGSGVGKTAGRGVKGQKSRSGGFHKVGFEGGQMPLHMRLPKRGFNVPNPKKLNAVNLGRLQLAVEAGKLAKGATVSATSLVEAGIIRRELDGVRILAKGALTEKLDFEVAGMSRAAQDAVEKLGGKVSILTPAKTDEAPKAKKAAKAEKAEEAVAETPAEDNASDDASDEASED